MHKEIVMKQYINIENVDVYYEMYMQRVNKPTAVLIHGFLSSSFSYRHLIPYLKKDFNIVAIDFPPFGKSGKSVKFIYSYKNIAMLVIKLLEKLHLSQVTLVGHSMGGQISLYISKLKPKLVDHMILLCSSGYLKGPSTSTKIGSYLPLTHYVIKSRLGMTGIKKHLYNVVFDKQLIDQEMMFGYKEPFLDQRIFRAIVRLIRYREGDLSSIELNEIDIPTLLLWGDHDKIVPLHIGEKLKKDLPNCDLQVLQNTGHLLPEEKPEMVYEQICSFTNQLNRKSI